MPSVKGQCNRGTCHRIHATRKKENVIAVNICTARSLVSTPLQKHSTNKLATSTDFLLHLQEAKLYDTRVLAACDLSAWTIYKTSTLQLRECTKRMQQAVRSQFLFLLANLPPFVLLKPHQRQQHDLVQRNFNLLAPSETLLGWPSASAFW